MSKSVEVLEAELLQLVERHDERIYRMNKLHDKALEYARRTEHEHKGRIDELEAALKAIIGDSMIPLNRRPPATNCYGINARLLYEAKLVLDGSVAEGYERENRERGIDSEV